MMRALIVAGALALGSMSTVAEARWQPTSTDVEMAIGTCALKEVILERGGRAADYLQAGITFFTKKGGFEAGLFYSRTCAEMEADPAAPYATRYRELARQPRALATIAAFLPEQPVVAPARP